ncbi:MAG TPA: class I SAM-dependent methyltransferase [Candidatus Saccharimonadales bacterium]|nr:class I SAM-dependent methyltransferase [Candidatus Saccharimonadales bacterium]
MSARRITLDTRIIEPARFAHRRVLVPEVLGDSEAADSRPRGAAASHRARMVEGFVRSVSRRAREGARVLDVGAGTGEIAVELALKRPDLRITGIDLSAGMLRTARRRVREAGVTRQVRMRKANARRLPFPGGSFDLVISSSVLHHLPDPGSTFDEIARVLARRGSVFIRDLRRPAPSRMKEHIRRHGRFYHGERRRLFAESVRAAFKVSEMREIVEESRLAGCRVRPQLATYLVIEGSPRRRG